jgi:hypothetical protein
MKRIEGRIKQAGKKYLQGINLLLRKNDWKKKIRRIYSANKELGKSPREKILLSQVSCFFKQYHLKVNPQWHQVYWQLNGIKDKKYMPDDIFHLYIEPRLNRKELCTGYIDKNIYDRLLPRVPLPKTIIRNMNGEYLDRAYNGISLDRAMDLLGPGEYIIKPAIDSSGGKNVRKLRVNANKTFLMDDKILQFSEVQKAYGKDFLIQELLKQHDFMNEIYPYSVNTIRVLTLKFNGKTHILSSVLRMGNKGAYIDNFSAGGVCCGINPKGILNDFAVDKVFHKYYEHPLTHFRFQGAEMPNYEGVEAFAKELHDYLPPYFQMVSWDIIIDQASQFNLIEFNMRSQQIDFHQIHNGPIFGDLTEQLLQQLFICQ